MTEIEENQTEADVDPIEVIYEGECPSLSGRSTLSYTIGRHTEDGTLHLRISDNSGKGMWCKDWCSASAIDDVALLGEGELTAKSFQVLHPGKSINNGGFICHRRPCWQRWMLRLRRQVPTGVQRKRQKLVTIWLWWRRRGG